MPRGESKPSICWDCARACGLAEVQCSLARERRCLLYALWIDVKHDKQVKQDKLDEIYDAAFACACEAVQVMAMCLKWGEGIEKRPDSV